MTRIRIIEGTVVNGGPVSAGQVVDAPPHDALYLIGLGRAEKFVEPPKEEPKPEVKAEPKAKAKAK